VTVQARVHIEQAFGIMKSRLPSLDSLPVRIGRDVIKAHNEVADWIAACLVLHNMLKDIGADEEWLGVNVDVGQAGEVADDVGDTLHGQEIIMKEQGKRRREELALALELRTQACN
jgi:hypothetical protein